MIKTAYCYASGQIHVGKKVPKGALPIITGPEKKVRDLIHATATLAYDNKTWLVPGIGLAPTQKEKYDALVAYVAWINPRMENRLA